MQFALIIQSGHVHGELGHQIVNSILCASSKTEYSIVCKFATPKQQPKLLSEAVIERERPPNFSVSEFNSKKFYVFECAVECQDTWMNPLKNSLHKEKRAYLYVDRRTLKHILVVWQNSTKSSKYPWLAIFIQLSLAENLAQLCERGEGGKKC